MIRVFSIVVAFLLLAALGTAQEVEVIDLTTIVPRTQLRSRDAAKPAYISAPRLRADTCEEGLPYHRGLRASLVSLDGSEYAEGDPMLVEAKVENVGELAIVVPLSPHIADLQPADPSLSFKYLELIVPTMYTGRNAVSANLANIILYGSPEHPETARELKHGEWIRVRAVIHPSFAQRDGMQVELAYGQPTRVYADWEFDQVTLRPSSEGYSREMCQLVLGRSPDTSAITVRFVKH